MWGSPPSLRFSLCLDHILPIAPAMPEEKTLFLGKCPATIQPDHIQQHYKALGPDAITCINFPRPGGVFKGFGFVTFRTGALAEQAASMPTPRVAGRTLTMSFKNKTDTGNKRMQQRLQDWQHNKRSP